MIMLGELKQLTPEEAAAHFRNKLALIRASFLEIKRRTPIRFAWAGKSFAFFRKLDPETLKAIEGLFGRLSAVREDDDFD